MSGFLLNSAIRFPSFGNFPFSLPNPAFRHAARMRRLLLISDTLSQLDAICNPGQYHHVERDGVRLHADDVNA